MFSDIPTVVKSAVIEKISIYRRYHNEAERDLQHVIELLNKGEIQARWGEI
jgi:hypothetical protein